MPGVTTLSGVIEVFLDDILIAITLGGLVLSGIYMRARLLESRRERDRAAHERGEAQ
jgi:hypothetical protein